MPAVANRSWCIVSSPRQRFIDRAALCCWLLLMAMMGSSLWPSSSLLWWCWNILLLGSAWVLLVRWWVRWRVRRDQPVDGNKQWLLYHDDQGWWRDDGDGYWRPLPLRAGSLKRPDCVLWQYGRWPWQRYLLRPDCFTNVAEFQQLRRMLYPDL